MATTKKLARLVHAMTREELEVAYMREAELRAFYQDRLFKACLALGVAPSKL